MTATYGYSGDGQPKQERKPVSWTAVIISAVVAVATLLAVLLFRGKAFRLQKQYDKWTNKNNKRESREAARAYRRDMRAYNKAHRKWVRDSRYARNHGKPIPPEPVAPDKASYGIGT